MAKEPILEKYWADKGGGMGTPVFRDPQEFAKRFRGAVRWDTKQKEGKNNKGNPGGKGGGRRHAETLR